MYLDLTYLYVYYGINKYDHINLVTSHDHLDRLTMIPISAAIRLRLGSSALFIERKKKRIRNEMKLSFLISLFFYLNYDGTTTTTCAIATCALNIFLNVAPLAILVLLFSWHLQSVKEVKRIFMKNSHRDHFQNCAQFARALISHT